MSVRVKKSYEHKIGELSGKNCQECEHCVGKRIFYPNCAVLPENGFDSEVIASLWPGLWENGLHSPSFLVVDSIVDD